MRQYELTEVEFAEAVKEFARRCGSEKAAAEELGVSWAYVHNVITQRRKPGPKFYKAMGYERIIFYRRNMIGGEK